jgi:hypothetical protein
VPPNTARIVNAEFRPIAAGMIYHSMNTVYYIRLTAESVAYSTHLGNMPETR